MFTAPPRRNDTQNKVVVLHVAMEYKEFCSLNVKKKKLSLYIQSTTKSTKCKQTINIKVKYNLPYQICSSIQVQNLT